MGNEATMQQRDERVDVYMGLIICLFPRPLPSGAKYILYPAKKNEKRRTCENVDCSVGLMGGYSAFSAQ